MAAAAGDGVHRDGVWLSGGRSGERSAAWADQVFFGGGGGDPEGIAAGADGDIWFTAPGVAKIGRIAPAGKVSYFSVKTAPDALGQIVAGRDGNLWFADGGSPFLSARIGRITPAGKVTEFETPDDPSALTAGPDGDIWFLESNVNRIARITPAGAITQFRVPPLTARSSANPITAITIKAPRGLSFTHHTQRLSHGISLKSSTGQRLTFTAVLGPNGLEINPLAAAPTLRLTLTTPTIVVSKPLSTRSQHRAATLELSLSVSVTSLDQTTTQLTINA